MIRRPDPLDPRNPRVNPELEETDQLVEGEEPAGDPPRDPRDSVRDPQPRPPEPIPDHPPIPKPVQIDPSGSPSRPQEEGEQGPDPAGDASRESKGGVSVKK